MGNNRNVAFWVVLFLLIVVLFNVFSNGSSGIQSREVPFSEFVKNVTGGQIQAVTLDGEKVRFTGPDKREQFTIRPGDADVTNLLIANDVAIRAEQQETSGLQSFLMTVFPFLLLIGVWIYFMNRMQGGGRGGAMGFGKSKAKLLTEKQGRVTFDDVAGIDEAAEAPPNHVHLYRRSILAEHRENREIGLETLVTHVLVHEIGHHFGLSDEDMHAIEDAAE